MGDAVDWVDCGLAEGAADDAGNWPVKETADWAVVVACACAVTGVVVVDAFDVGVATEELVA